MWLHLEEQKGGNGKGGRQYWWDNVKFDLMLHREVEECEYSSRERYTIFSKSSSLIAFRTPQWGQKRVIQYYNIIIHLATSNCLSLHSTRWKFSASWHIFHPTKHSLQLLRCQPPHQHNHIKSTRNGTDTMRMVQSLSPAWGNTLSSVRRLQVGRKWLWEEKCVHYCCQQCHRDDWRYHKLLCKKLKPFSIPNPALRLLTSMRYSSLRIKQLLCSFGCASIQAMDSSPWRQIQS